MGNCNADLLYAVLNIGQTKSDKQRTLWTTTTPHCLSIRTTYVHVVTAFKNWIVGCFISYIKELTFRPKFLGYISLKRSYTSH